ncbi:hypothetical protein ABT112_06995 [Streptomyces sp. NPDC002055]|uniref:glycosyltransferase n=1 Tax=Streptomyces sp. NPDC002055 TaxID=3154534 RepID=UPI0033320D78
MSGSGPLVLIEPNAHRLGGHYQTTLAALATARPGSVVITPSGLAADPAPLRAAGTRLVSGARGPMAAVLLAAARGALAVSRAGQRAFASRRWPLALRRAPHQVTLVARCLTEAACLHTARRLVRDPASVVVLTASEALHGAAALLGGQPHLRFVHEQVTTEDTPVRLLGRLAQRGEKRVMALYPTAAVREEHAAAFPRLPGMVRAFAVDDGSRLTDAERTAAREAFGIPSNAVAVSVVGSWWPCKDIATIDAALPRVRTPLHLLVLTGSPLDEAVLHRWQSLPRIRAHIVRGPVAETDLRRIYAASSAVLVARRPGEGKESGLAMDAARHGVPLLVSDHDPHLTAQLAGRSWARVFPAGDPAGLAAAFDRLATRPLATPAPGDGRVLGMAPAAEQAAFLTDLYHDLIKERP